MMLLGGQWIAKYEGTNQGTLVVDVDEVDDHLEMIACAWDDVVQMPSTAISISTLTRAPAQRIQNVALSALDASGRRLDPANLRQRGIAFPGFADVEFELNPQDQLMVSWKTNIGTSGVALAPRSSAGQLSKLKPLAINDWRSFKEYVGNLERNRYIFRGQSSNNWRLRTSFHRTSRANLSKYEAFDIVQLHRYLSALDQDDI